MKINKDRLLDRLFQIGEICETNNGGSNRQAFTPGDVQARETLVAWAAKLGGVAECDSMGNLFIHFNRRETAALPILVGSHLDTQPTGGKYDGVYGVIAGLEVIESIYEQNIVLEHPLVLAVWANEEGARFRPAMMGSGVFSGKLSQTEMYQSQDQQGMTYYEALVDSGQLGARPAQVFPLLAALEVHIEQGPILDAKSIPIGVVTGIQGIHWFEVTVKGETTHAGPTPMSMRKDAVRSTTRIIQQLYQLVDAEDDQARLTIGQLRAYPGSVNTLPSHLSFSVDIRHPDEDKLQQLVEGIQARLQSPEPGIEIAVNHLWHSPVIKFNDKCIQAIQKATEICELPSITMVSGAGHDSAYLAQVIPTAMIFIPCHLGISHNEAEYAHPDHLEAGAQVLLQTIINLSTAANKDSL